MNVTLDWFGFGRNILPYSALRFAVPRLASGGKLSAKGIPDPNECQVPEMKARKADWAVPASVSMTFLTARVNCHIIPLSRAHFVRRCPLILDAADTDNQRSGRRKS